MTVLTATLKATPADLLSAPESKALELVNGELVEKKVGVLAGVVEVIIAARLHGHCESTNGGHVISGGTGYRCFPDDPGKVRKPDVSFIRANRFEARFLQDGFMMIHPDLAVEVVSPNDLADEVAEKVEDYRSAQVPLIWVVYPEHRFIDVYRKDGSNTRLNADAEISGEGILPGFRCSVASFFPSSS